MALVEGEQVEHLVAPREDDDRGIGEADLEVGAVSITSSAMAMSAGLERLEAVGAAATSARSGGSDWGPTLVARR